MSGYGGSRLTTPPDSTLRPIQKLRKLNKINTISDGVVKKHTWTPTEWTRINPVFHTANLPSGQTTLGKLAAFRYKDPKERSAGDKIKESDVGAFHQNSSARDVLPAGECLLISEHHGQRDSSSTEVEPTFCHGEKLAMEGPMGLEDTQWQDISLFADAGSDNVAMDETANLDRMQWQDISLFQDESDDEFPMLDSDVAEMARLRVSDTESRTINSPSIFQAQGGQDFQDHGASHDQRSSSPSRTSNVKAVLPESPDRDSAIAKYPLSLSRDASLASIHGRKERGLMEEEAPTNEGHHDLRQPEPQARYAQADDSANYLPITPFARPPFPSKVTSRSPIAGVSASTALRTCFRIGEAICQSVMPIRQGQEVIIELFARIKLSRKDAQTSVYYFELSDLFHDRPPFLTGRLERMKRGSLQEMECNLLLGEGALGKMARCLGRLMRGNEGEGPTLRIMNVRESDWEEVRWTRGVLEGGEGGGEEAYS